MAAATGYEEPRPDGGRSSESEPPRGQKNDKKRLVLEEDTKMTPKEWVMSWFTKGPLSNITTFVIMVIGFIILAATEPGLQRKGAEVECPLVKPSFGNIVGQYFFAFGLFGFAGGVTNWLAVKMLFDPVLNLPGTGVIPRRFKEIRLAIKFVIIRTFFDADFLAKYMQQKAAQMTANIKLDEKIKTLLESPMVDQVIDQKLAELGNRPEGMMMAMMGMTPAALKPMVKPFILSMGSEAAPKIMENFDPEKMMDQANLQEEVDKMLTAKLQELTPVRVKNLMEKIIREHLGWLVVWGNVFGGSIGIVCTFFGY